MHPAGSCAVCAACCALYRCSAGRPFLFLLPRSIVDAGKATVHHKLPTERVDVTKIVQFAGGLYNRGGDGLPKYDGNQQNQANAVGERHLLIMALFYLSSLHSIYVCKRSAPRLGNASSAPCLHGWATDFADLISLPFPLRRSQHRRAQAQGDAFAAVLPIRARGRGLAGGRQRRDRALRAHGEQGVPRQDA